MAESSPSETQGPAVARSLAPPGSPWLGGMVEQARRLVDRALVRLSADRRLAVALALVLLLGGLLLPPVSLLHRLATRDYAVVAPGLRAVVASQPPGAWLEVHGEQLTAVSRWRLTSQDQLPRGIQRLPEGYVQASRCYRLSLQGEAPARAALEVGYSGPAAAASLADAFGWDGRRWRWLPMQFASSDRAKVSLRPREVLPQWIVLATAGERSTEVSAVLVGPPTEIPAAAAEFGLLELRAYHLADDDGTVRGQAFSVPSSRAERLGVLDNREGQRVRSDLVNNMLVSREARQRHREAIVEIVRRDRLAGVVIEYDGVRGDRQGLFGDWLGRLAIDLHNLGAELVVSLPTPSRRGDTWDGQPYDWFRIGQVADAVRIKLPDTPPLPIDEMDSLVRWAFGTVPRHRLQLALPAMGRDQVDSEVTAIAFGDALARILDMAQADAPRWIQPGATVEVDLPTVRAAHLGRELDTGQWRFDYWDANRRRHTVWLNDAASLKPAFDIAQRYRLGRIALDGFTTGIDPSLWRMTTTFLRHGTAATTVDRYFLTCRLVDARGVVVQEISQPLHETRFEFRAPVVEGNYRMLLGLTAPDGRALVTGAAVGLTVARAPEPTATLPVTTYRLLPTAETVITVPPPPDELRLQRTPVRASVPGTATPIADFDAITLYPMGELRAAPSFEAEKISDLRPGEVMLVVGRTPDGNWLNVVLLATGLSGWLRAELVELRKPLQSVPVVLATPSPGR